MSTDCGGCQGLGSHARDCTANPNYSYRRVLAERAEDLGDTIGSRDPAAANACYRAAGLLRAGTGAEVPRPRLFHRHRRHLTESYAGGRTYSWCRCGHLLTTPKELA